MALAGKKLSLLFFFPWRKENFRISSLPHSLPPGGPCKQYSLAQQGTTTYSSCPFPPSSSSSPMSLLETDCSSQLFSHHCALAALHPWSTSGLGRNERTGAVSATLGPRSLVIRFFNEHRGQGLERKVGVHRRASTICDWIIKS